MILKLFCLIIGINICAISLMFCLIYLNLLTFGFSFWGYIKFIFSRLEILMFIIGLLLIYISIHNFIKNCIK